MPSKPYPPADMDPPSSGPGASEPGFGRKSAPPSPWVRRFAPLAPRGARILDLACGHGRNGRMFLDHGCRVLFLDINISSVADLASRGGAWIIAADLETEAGLPLLPGRFDMVVATSYLWRPLLPELPRLLAPGGFLLYETFARGNERFGRPRNPDYLLEEGELRRAFGRGMTLIAYEHGLRPDPAAILQRVVFRAPVE